MECLRGGLAGLIWLIGSCACNQVYPGRVRVLLDFFHSLNVLSFFYRDSSLSTSSGRLATAINFALNSVCPPIKIPLRLQYKAMADGANSRQH